MKRMRSELGHVFAMEFCKEELHVHNDSQHCLHDVTRVYICKTLKLAAAAGLLPSDLQAVQLLIERWLGTVARG